MKKYCLNSVRELLILLFFMPVLHWWAYADYEECNNECAPPRGCETLVECKIAQMECLQSCKQRKVWERLEGTLAKLAVSIAQSKETAEPEEIASTSAFSIGEGPQKQVGATFPTLGQTYKKDGSPSNLIVDKSTDIITDKEFENKVTDILKKREENN